MKLINKVLYTFFNHTNPALQYRCIRINFRALHRRALFFLNKLLYFQKYLYLCCAHKPTTTMARKPKPVEDQSEYDIPVSSSDSETVEPGIIKAQPTNKITPITPIAIQQQQAFRVSAKSNLVTLRNTKLGTIETVDEKTSKIFVQSGNYTIL